MVCGERRRGTPSLHSPQIRDFHDSVSDDRQGKFANADASTILGQRPNGGIRGKALNPLWAARFTVKRGFSEAEISGGGDDTGAGCQVNGLQRLYLNSYRVPVISSDRSCLSSDRTYPSGPETWLRVSSRS